MSALPCARGGGCSPTCPWQQLLAHALVVDARHGMRWEEEEEDDLWGTCVSDRKIMNSRGAFSSIAFSTIIQ